MKFMDFRCSRNSTYFQQANIRLSYLKRQASTVMIAASPDYGEKGIINNGMYLETINSLYPLFAGLDIGCGFYTCFFCGNARAVKYRMERYTKSVSECYDMTQDALRTMKCSSNMLKYISIKLTPGNHFIELRKVCDVFDSRVCDKLGISGDTYSLMIHMGSGEFIEGVTKNNILRCVQQCSQSQPNSQNGYSIKLQSDDAVSRQYLDHADFCNRLAFYARKCIAQYILGSVKALFEFDAPHDFFEERENHIFHFKSVQPFRVIQNENIALMPGDKNDLAYLVKKGPAEFQYTNHGLNYNTDQNGGFESSRATILHCEQVGLSSPIVSLSPLAIIKNANNNLIFKD